MYSLTLSTPGLTTVTIGDGGDFGLTQLDLGFPEIREVSTARPSADGTIDETSLIGRRAITAQILLLPGTWTREQDLRAFLSPRWRSSMLITLPDAPDLVTTVRGASMTAPVELEDLAGNIKRISCQWIAPLGVLESSVVRSAIATAAGSVPSPGRVYDLVFDRDYPDAAPSGTVTCTNAGTSDAYPLLKVYGPCTGPVVQHIESGRELAFPGLSIAAGDFLEIDTRDRTIRYNGNQADSRYDTLDFDVSSWWGFAPGTQQVRFVPDTFTAPSQVLISWRDAWL